MEERRRMSYGSSIVFKQSHIIHTHKERERERERLLTFSIGQHGNLDVYPIIKIIIIIEIIVIVYLTLKAKKDKIRKVK